jgi:hypothetical protein
MDMISLFLLKKSPQVDVHSRFCAISQGQQAPRRKDPAVKRAQMRCAFQGALLGYNVGSRQEVSHDRIGPAESGRGAADICACKGTL